MSVLFCPFCEESFEGLTQCPEHELELVAFDKLKSRLDEDAQRERTSDEKPIDASARVSSGSAARMRS